MTPPRWASTTATRLSCTRAEAGRCCPQCVTDRVRPGNCFVPFHWNDEHGEYLAINAVTIDAVDAESLQPEFKACAVALRPVAREIAPGQGRAMHPIGAALGLTDSAPLLTDDEKQYLSGFFTALPRALSYVPMLPATAPVRGAARLYIDGLLAGAFARGPTEADGNGQQPLVMWASQTGTAEDFAARVAQQLDTAGAPARLITMDDCTLEELAAARDVLVVTSTFGDGGPPDNGAGFWSRLESDDAPTLDGMRYAVLGIGDRSYDNFCGHAKSIDARLGDLGATKLIERAECEADDDEPMARWADRVTKLLSAPVNGNGTGVTGNGTATRGNGIATAPLVAKPRVAKPFTRTRPVPVPLSRNVVLTTPTGDKEVRQFGFDISEHDVTYSVGDTLGVYAPNHPAMVNRWLAATGLSADEVVELNGGEMALREALTSHYDICRATPNLLDFIAECCTDASMLKALRAQNPIWTSGWSDATASTSSSSSRCGSARGSGKKRSCG